MVADDVDQAACDLRVEWGRQQRERWVLDTDQPLEHAEAVAADRAALPRPAAEAVLRRRLAAEEAAVNTVIPPDTSAALEAAIAVLADVEQRRRCLDQAVADPTGWPATTRTVTDLCTLRRSPRPTPTRPTGPPTPRPPTHAWV